MPDYGRLTLNALPHAAPAIAPLYPPPPWPLPGVRVLKLAFETDIEPVLQWLPPKLSRSAPPYAIVTVAHHPESPIGPFSVASQYIGCRAGMFVRAFTLQAVADRPAAVAALREVWGVPCELGEVYLEARAHEALAQVGCADGAIAEISLRDGGPIDGDAVRFDPMLNVRMTPSLEEGKRHDLLQLVQIDPDYETKEALRGQGSLRYLSESRAHPWHLLPVRNVISAVCCRIDTEMPLARFVMPY